MSRRTAEANKAIRKAWEKEQQLVREGKGTRDWTPEQQKDILDPNKGKAYDDNGRAYEGQHMRSASEYSELQGDPDNIQFLTREEHLAAHKGNWQNPTNWYYNPDTKEFLDFEDGDIIPCKNIELNYPISNRASEIIEKSIISEDFLKTENAKNNKTFLNNKRINSLSRKVKQNKTGNKTTKLAKEIVSKPNVKNKFIRGLKKIGKFIVEHPVESLEIAGVTIYSSMKVISSINSNSISKSSSNNMQENNTTQSINSNTAIQVADNIVKAKRSSPREHIVSPNAQHYHTKNGIILKEKDAYPRGRKKDL